MTGKTAGSRRLHPEASPKRILDTQYITSSARKRQPARCELYGVRLVHRLPPCCPMATLNPLTTIERIRAIAWRAIGDPHSSERGEALEVYEQAETCMACMERILPHPTVRRLRASTGCSA